MARKKRLSLSSLSLLDPSRWKKKTKDENAEEGPSANNMTGRSIHTAQTFINTSVSPGRNQEPQPVSNPASSKRGSRSRRISAATETTPADIPTTPRRSVSVLIERRAIHDAMVKTSEKELDYRRRRASSYPHMAATDNPSFFLPACEQPALALTSNNSSERGLSATADLILNGMVGRDLAHNSQDFSQLARDPETSTSPNSACDPTARTASNPDKDDSDHSSESSGPPADWQEPAHWQYPPYWPSELFLPAPHLSSGSEIGPLAHSSAVDKQFPSEQRSLAEQGPSGEPSLGQLASPSSRSYGQIPTVNGSEGDNSNSSLSVLRVAKRRPTLVSSHPGQDIRPQSLFEQAEQRPALDPADLQIWPRSESLVGRFADPAHLASIVTNSRQISRTQSQPHRTSFQERDCLYTRTPSPFSEVSLKEMGKKVGKASGAMKALTKVANRFKKAGQRKISSLFKKKTIASGLENGSSRARIQVVRNEVAEPQDNDKSIISEDMEGKRAEPAKPAQTPSRQQPTLQTGQYLKTASTPTLSAPKSPESQTTLVTLDLNKPLPFARPDADAASISARHQARAGRPLHPDPLRSHTNVMEFATKPPTPEPEEEKVNGSAGVVPKLE